MQQPIRILSISFFAFATCKLQLHLENQIVSHQLKKIYDSTSQDDQSYIAFLIENDLNGFSTQLYKYISKRGNALSIVLSTNGQCNWDVLNKTLQKRFLGRMGIIYMFVDPSIVALNSTFHCLEQMTIWRPRTKTVLILSAAANAETIIEIFRLCWELKMLNTVAISPDHNSTILGFNPFINQYYQSLNDEEIFYDKLANLYGFKINILLTKPDDPAKVRIVTTANNETGYIGKDARAILTTLQYYNATYGVLNIQEKLGWSNPFRSFHRNSKDDERQQILTDNNIDLFFLSQEMRLNNNISEMIYPHSKDDLVFMVPRAGYISQYDQLLRFFQDGFSLFLIFFLLVCPLIWFAICLTEAWLKGQRHLNWTSLFSLFLENFKIILGGSTDVPFPNFVEKFFLIVLCLCYLVINNYFQSILVSIITVQRRLPEINTIDDMIASSHIANIPENMLAEMTALFNNTRQVRILEKLRAKRTSTSSPRPDLHNFARNLSFLVNNDRAEMLHVQRPYFRACRESPLPAYVAFPVVKNSPFFDLVDKTIPRLLETGLYYFWHRDNMFVEILYEGVIYEEDDENWDVQSLSMYQFRAGVYLMLLGLSVSLCVFIIELVCYYVSRRCCKGKIRENII